MSSNIGIIIVDKLGALKERSIKEYKEEELYKACGFKKPDGFEKQTEWSSKLDGPKYNIALFAKTEGKPNTENKYDFPPPVDTTLFFGSCALVFSNKQDDGTYKLVSIKLDQWEKIYEKLFGGFEDLAVTCAEDDAEEDELANVPEEKKTKHGYLKDGFVVDSDSEGNEDYISDEDETEETESDETEDNSPDGEIVLEDIGSELSEEAYESDNDESDNN
jgi:hypothetical protein